MSVGPLTVARHARLREEGVYLHVFVHGVDVTDRCKFADDTPGSEVAWLFKLDATGRKYLDSETGFRSPALETVREAIEIRELVK